MSTGAIVDDCLCLFVVVMQCKQKISFSDSVAPAQWRRYTRARQVKWLGWKIHRPGSSPRSALPSPAYCFASIIWWTENKNVTISDRFICFILTVKRGWRPVFWGRQLKKGRQLFWGKVHPGDLAGGFSDLEMTWLLYCAGAATAPLPLLLGHVWILICFVGDRMFWSLLSLA